MKINKYATFALLALSLVVLPCAKYRTSNSVLLHTEAVVLDGDNLDFDFYSSSDSSFTYEDGLLIPAGSGELKAIVKDFSSHTVDARFTIPLISVATNLNGGMYFHAKDAGNNVDQIDAFNVQVEKDAGSDHFRISVFEFTNSAFIGRIANTVEFAAPTRNLNIRVTIDENDLNVYLNNNDVPSLNKKIKSFNKDGTQVGFRSMHADQRFSNISISSEIEQKDIPTVKVLMVGNSYAVDTMTFCHEIAASQGVNMVCGVMYYGGCTVRQHAHFIEENSAVYTYYKNAGEDKFNATFDDILFDEDWDYITIQSGSGDQGIKSTYYPYIQKIISYIEYKLPRAEIGIFQSWHQPKCLEGTGNGRLSKYGDSSETMYQEIVKATNEIKEETGLAFTVASCEILHRINETSVCDDTALETSFQRDTTGHQNENGRYMMGMLMYKTITGKYVGNVEYLPYGYSYGTTLGPNKDTADVIKETVEGIFDQYESMNHLVNPRAVESLKIDKYKQNYVEGDFFDYQSVKLMAVYEDGAIKQTNNFFIDITRALTLEDREITLTYQGKSITLPISVTRK